MATNPLWVTGSVSTTGDPINAEATTPVFAEGRAQALDAAAQQLTNPTSDPTVVFSENDNDGDEIASSDAIAGVKSSDTEADAQSASEQAAQ